MSEDIIQRPKGRRNNSIDLGPSHTEQPEKTKKEPISFGKKKAEVQSSSQNDETQRKQVLSFGKKKETPVVQPKQNQLETERPVNSVQPESERRSYSASIDTGRTVNREKASIDLNPNHTHELPRQKQDSMDLKQRQPEQSTIDVGPPATPDHPQTRKNKPSLGSLGNIIPLGKKEETEDRKGTWGNTGYNASNEQAHRDVTYHIPSFTKQTIVMFMVQMKLFSKMKWTYFMLFVALLIPIIMFAGEDMLMTIMRSYGFVTDYSNTYIAGLLSFLPLLLGLFTSVLCGSQLPNEFKERTAYMNVSLPMNRASFYLGKYLAGFVMSLAIFMFAYGMAIATAMTKYDAIFADLLSASLGMTIVAVFAYSSTAFCIGSFMRRGSSMVPFILMTIALPLVCTLLFAYFQTDGPDLSWLFLLPCFLGEAALGILGAPMSGSVGILVMQYMDLTNPAINIGVGVVWGALFLLLGLFKTMRREM